MKSVPIRTTTLPSATTGELVDADPRRFVNLRIRQLLTKGESPLEFLLKQMQDTKNSVQFRVYCAVQSAPYCHTKPNPEDAVDPHEAFMEEVRGMKDRLLDRLVREVQEEEAAVEAEKVVDKARTKPPTGEKK